MNCITHHNACDCREAEHAAELAALKAANVALTTGICSGCQAAKSRVAELEAELDSANHAAMFANDAPPEWDAERDRLTKHCTKLAVEMNADKLYMLKLFAQIAGYRKEIDELGRTLDSIADLPARSAALRATMGR